MKKDLKKRLAIYARNCGALVALSPLAAFAQAAPDISGSISSAQSEILGYIATGGAALIAIALAVVGWGVGVKLIKRLRGAA